MKSKDLNRPDCVAVGMNNLLDVCFSLKGCSNMATFNEWVFEYDELIEEYIDECLALWIEYNKLMEEN